VSRPKHLVSSSFPALAAVLGFCMSALPALAVAPLELPKIHEERLGNGLAVVTVEKKGLPLVSVRLLLPTGSVRDPKGKDGLASFTAGLLRRGTTTRTAEQIDDAIESVGGLLALDAGMEASSVSATVPSEHVGAALEVIADLVRNPSFPKKEVELERRQELARLQQDLDDPSAVADRALVRFFYGDGHPYGHPVEGRTATVKTFTRADVAAFHKGTFTPRGATLLFVGEITPAAALVLAKGQLGAWSGPQLPAIELARPASPKGLEILLVDKPDASQAQVRASVPGIARKDPTFHAQAVANTIVGGGFTSRLVDEVRVNRGLSYSVSTRVVALREFGALSYTTFTKTETVRQILDVSLSVLDAFGRTGPTADELEKAKRYVIGLYPSRVESIDQLSEALGSARVLGLPFESIASYRDEVAGVSPVAAAEVARRYPSSTSAKIVVVGKAAEIRPQLAGLGTVTEAKASAYE
jgi:zinc protease